MFKCFLYTVLYSYILYIKLYLDKNDLDISDKTNYFFAYEKVTISEQYQISR